LAIAVFFVTIYFHAALPPGEYGLRQGNNHGASIVKLEPLN
jgi:hypothetical protein